MVERGSRQLGRFVCNERVGGSPVGPLHRARVFGDAGFAKDFALLIVDDKLARDRLALARLVRAANAWAQLSHPRIAKAHEFAVESETYYLVSDWRRGGSLAAILEDGPLPPDAALVLAADVADAVAHAHARQELVPGGVLHLGLTPENLYVDGDGNLQVRDFCITQARITPGWADNDKLVATLRYGSPELQSGNPVDLRADVFALGAVLFEMFTGRHAFPGERAREVTARVLQTPPSLEGVPGSAGPLVARALALNPGARLPSMIALRDQALALVGPRYGAARQTLAERARKRLPGEVPLPNNLTAASPADVAEQRALDEKAKNTPLEELFASLPPLAMSHAPIPSPPPLDIPPVAGRALLPPARPSVWDPPSTTATLSLEALRRQRPRPWLRLGVPLALVVTVAGGGTLWKRVQNARARIHAAEQLEAARNALPPADQPPPLMLTSLPPGARVFVDGVARGTTPVKLGLSRGRHQLVLIADNYRLYRAELTGQDKIDVRLEPAELPEALAGDAGLKIACKGDRRVFVDNVDTGRACPVDDRIPIAPGPHQLALYQPQGDRMIQVARPANVRDRGSSTRIVLDE